MKKYFLFFEDRRLGYAVRIISKKEAHSIAEDEENFDLVCFFKYKESDNKVWLPMACNFDIYCTDVNFLPVRNVRSDDYPFLINLAEVQKGDVIYRSKSEFEL